MPLDPLQTTTADVLAVRILLGQLVVRIAAGSDNAAAVLELMRDSALQTAATARLRGLPEEQTGEVREHLKGSIERFFDAMRIGAPPPAASPERSS